MVMPRVARGLGGDVELEAALAGRDKDRVLTLLMARYGDGLYRYALAMVRDRNLAEEVRQQVFFEAYRDLDNVAESVLLPTWLFGIARNRCLDAVNTRARWYQRYKNEPADEPGQVDCELDHDLDRCKLARILTACIRKLAPAARDAVILRYQQEMSYDDAAAISGDLPGTLQRRVARALPVLRRCVEAKLQPGAST